MHKFGSFMITVLLQDLELEGRSGSLYVPTGNRVLAEILKKLTRYFVIERSNLRFAQRGQRLMVRRLYFALHSLAMETAAASHALHGMPPRFWDYRELALQASSIDGYSNTSQRMARATVDFICSLTDRQAAAMSRELEGQSDAPDPNPPSL